LNLSAKSNELAKFLLDCLQTFMPLAMSNLSLYFIPGSTPVLLVEPWIFAISGAETPDLCR
jgi:hypothetical protein